MTLLSVSSTIGLVIDIAIIAVLVVFALVGLRNGFFKSVISMISTVVVIVASIFCASPVAKMINKIYNFTGLIASKLCKSIAGMGAFYSAEIPNGISGKDIASNIPPDTNGFLKKLMQNVLNPLSASDIQGRTVADIVSGAFASIIFTIIVGILLFILIKIVVSLASKLFENIAHIRTLGALNKVFGLIFGMLKGGLIIITLSFVLTFLTVIPKVNKDVSPLIQNHTKIAKPIYSFTDDIVEKHIVKGNVIQKWINNLWENKKSTNNTPVPEISDEPNGSLTKPYNITLSNNIGTLSSSFSVVFDNSENICYIFSPSEINDGTFTLTIVVEGARHTLYASDNTSAEISDSDYTSLDRTKNYIIKFTLENTSLSSVDVTITLTGNVE